MTGETLKRIKKPHCYLVYALAPDSLPAADANRTFNALIADRAMPMAIFHDHFIGRGGGLAIVYVQDERERDALLQQKHLEGWTVEYHALVFSHSPSGFDDQISWTLAAYRHLSWEGLRRDQMPRGEPLPAEED